MFPDLAIMPMKPEKKGMARIFAVQACPDRAAG